MIGDFIRELWRFFLLYLIRPIVLLLGALVTAFYNVLFAWWLDGLTSKGLRRRFERDIRKEHSWLFEKYDAKIIPRAKITTQVLDYASVIVAVDHMLLSFVRGRGEAYVSIAPSHAPHDWYKFGEAIVLACDKAVGSSETFDRMSEFRRLFEANFGSLKAFFSEAKYGQPRRDRSAIKLIPL